VAVVRDVNGTEERCQYPYGREFQNARILVALTRRA
jgi:hypothetical protein